MMRERMWSLTPMADCPVHSTLSIGPIAADHLRERVQRGSVAAVFSSVFYVRLPGGLVCVTNADVEDGPISVRANMSRDWQRAGLILGQPVALAHPHLRIAGLLSLDLATARVWHPEIVVSGAVQRPEGLALRQLDARLAGRGTLPGLGALLGASGQPQPGDAVLGRAAVQIDAARNWMTTALRGAPQCAPDWAVSLLGYGAGLTPSGDDVLGGMLIALHATGHGAVARALWQDIAPHLATRTNRISAALLTASADGLGSASVHDAIAALLRFDVDGLDRALVAIDRIGHSSGWDTLLGVVTVLDALTASPDQRAA
ncbi:MAG: DUF2877 domain-containing protein [Rhodobacteraceae bacterium]|nr:DUF2877 domain-containing protein [Paracoccaceae bacterium]